MDASPQLQNRLKTLEEVIRKTPNDVLQQRIYTCVANTCTLLTAYKRQKGAPGWSKFMVDENNESFLTDQQQKLIESSFAQAPWILQALEEPLEDTPMTGGGDGSAELHSGVFVQDANAAASAHMKDVDFDLNSVKEVLIDKTRQYDAFWTEYAKGNPITAKLKDTELYGIRLEPIVLFIKTILDTIRYVQGTKGESSTLLTLVVLFEELLMGEWRQMILTSLAFISPTGMAMGVILKLFVNAWMFISPSIRDDIFRDVFRGTKSLFVGILLWMMTILPPAYVKENIEMGLEKIRILVGGLETKTRALEEEGSKALRPLGKKLKIVGLNTEAISKISIYDIQNLQSLLQWDVITCSSEFRSIIDPLAKEPIFRFLLELLNIPVLPEDVAVLCGKEGIVPIAEKLQDSVKGVVVEDEGAGTGDASATPEISQEPGAREKAPEEAKAPAPAPAPAPEPKQTGGKPKRKSAPMKLKKSTRYRKATPRRQTRRTIL